MAGTTDPVQESRTPREGAGDSSADTPRLLLISDRYFPHVGGSIHWFHNIYQRRPAGSVFILTQQYPEAEEFDRAHPQFGIVRRDLKRYRFLKPESLLLYLKLLWTGAAMIRRHKIQVIHASKVLPEGYVARALSRLFHIPYILFAHGEEITIFGKNAKQRRHLPKVYDGADAVIANSRFTVGELRKIGCEGGNIARISPGVDPSTFRPAEKDSAIAEKLGLEGKKVILSVGRLTKRKGHDHVIDALPEVLAKHPETVYVILSTGEESENLRARVSSKGLEASVRLVGEVPYEDLPKYYNACDVFVLANRELPDGDMEGFGIVFLEANACEKPVIAGDSGGTSDPVREGVNGFLVDASEPGNIADAVIRVFDDPKRAAEMGRAGRAIVDEEYAWDKVVANVEDLSRRVIAGESTNEKNRLIAQP